MHRGCADGSCPRQYILGKDEGHRYCGAKSTGKDHDMPEHYFEDVLEGACLIEGQCSKDIMFE